MITAFFLAALLSSHGHNQATCLTPNNVRTYCELVGKVSAATEDVLFTLKKTPREKALKWILDNKVSFEHEYTCLNLYSFERVLANDLQNAFNEDYLRPVNRCP